MSRSLHLGAVVALAAAAASLGGCMGTRNYGTGEAPELAILNEISGGIGLGGKKEAVEYQPRAPLVLPPSTQLRDPIETADAANPQWPVDPDKRRASAELDDELTPAEREELKKYAFLNSNRRKAGASAGDDENVSARDTREQNRKFRAALADREGDSATERRYLTEPPLDYRAPASTAPTEFEDIGPTKKKGLFSRMFGSS